MKKTFKKATLIISVAVLFVVCLAFSASANTWYGDYEYYSNGDGTITISDYSGSATSLVIPSTLNGYTVTGIGYDAFYYSSNLQYVTIPNTVKEIGDYAFHCCYSLKTVTFGSGVKTIGAKAFADCESLERINFGSALKIIEDSAFENCISLTSVSIPYGTVSIGGSAFSGCYNLSTISLPTSVRDIGYLAFYNTAYYNRAANWTNNVLYIGNHLIRAKKEYSGGCYVKTGTLTIADSAFYTCENLTSVVVPTGVTDIGEKAFQYCYSLSSITLPDSLIDIGYLAFYNTSYYDSVANWTNNALYIGKHLIRVRKEYTGAFTVRTGTLTIAEKALLDCTGLNDVTIPSTVRDIGYLAFYNTAFYNTDSKWVNDALYSGDILIRVKKEHAGSIAIKGGTRMIASGAFNSCNSLTRVDIPYSVKKIGKDAFFNCSALRNINFQGSNAVWNTISIASGNDLTGVVISYNYNHTHSYTSATTSSATCTASGVVTYRCACGDSYTKYVSSYGHNYSTEYTVDTAATCTTSGQKSRHCTRSGCSSRINITTIPATGHAYGLWTVVTPATCTTSGTEQKVCSSCSNVVTMTIAALGHSYSSEYTIDKAATCASEGRKSRHCTRGGCTSVVDVTAIAKKEHKYSAWEEATPATCTDDGFMERVCTGCGDTQTGEIPARGHSFSSSYTVDKKATLSASGVKSKHCTRDDCTAKASKTTIAKISSVKLSKTSYTYDGKVKSPSVTVKDSNGKTLKKGTDYTVSYESGRKYPGRYTVKVTFKGSYSGTKKVEFTIAPKATSKITATQTTTTITLKWNKVPGAYGYRVYKYNSKSKSYKFYKETKSTTMKLTGLSAGTTYKFKVMAYDVDNGKIYGKYSSAFETATKTKTPTLKSVTSSTKGKAVIKWNNVTGESGYQVYYSTSKGGTYKKVDSYAANKTAGSKSKLTSKKTYYFKVRAYKKTASGTVFSAWSSVKSVKIK